MTELVLGGDGLIGTALIQALRARGANAVSLDLKNGCDLRLAKPEQFAGFDRVWFLAWDTGGAKYIEATDRQHAMYRHNSELCARVFDILQRLSLPFLFVTSQLAGQPNAYGMTKLLGEYWSRQLGGKVARLWNTYGWEHPDARSHVVTDLVLSGLNGRVRCMTRGEERRRLIYKTDCVEALLALFDGEQAEADIAGPEWLSIRQVAEEVARQLNVEVELGNALGSEVPIDPAKLLPQWQPQISFEEGIAKVIADARDYLSQEQTAAAGARIE